jgi:hypothetical protein
MAELNPENAKPESRGEATNPSRAGGEYSRNLREELAPN